MVMRGLRFEALARGEAIKGSAELVEVTAPHAAPAPPMPQLPGSWWRLLLARRERDDLLVASSSRNWPLLLRLLWLVSSDLLWLWCWLLHTDHPQKNIKEWFVGVLVKGDSRDFAHTPDLTLFLIY